ncbi:hypothetical protein D3C76_1357580 [compost metagenome]
MPCLASNWARPALKLAMAPLVAAYANRLGDGSSELTELVLMIEAPLPIDGNARWQMRKIAVMLVSKVFTHSSSSISSRVSWAIWNAALLTRMSMRPNCATVLSTIS